MITLFDQKNTAQIFIAPHENPCVEMAVQDLVRDLARAGSRISPEVKRSLPASRHGRIIIGTITSPDYALWLHEQGIEEAANLSGQWEHYTIHVTDEDDSALIIAGSDERGTMYGIYEISVRILHIDPTYIFTGILPDPVDHISMESGQVITEGPSGFPFRGWFINDEDLLEGFSRERPVDTGYDFHHDYQKVLPLIVETALRLKQNLLIPCSELDIMDPEQEALIPLVTERGMFVSMHHQQPCGLNQKMLDHIWRQEVPEGELNYCDRPDLYRKSWAAYISKWAKYDHVIWQLGLRGRGDRPVWYQATNVPDTDEARGALISRAVQDQYELIEKISDRKPFYSTSTLWMEGMQLYQKGTLSFPKNTMVIFADFGPDQMLQDFYYQAPRLAGTKYGIYYHVAFWGCGPHLVEGTSPWKIAYNYEQLVQHGDTCYSILNVSNIREHLMGINAVAEVTWNPEAWDPDAFLQRWCSDHYGKENAEGTADLWKQWFSTFHVMDSSVIPDHMLLMDGMCRRVGYKLLEVIGGKEFVPIDIQNKKLFAFENTDDFVNYYLSATKEKIPAFENLLTAEAECLKNLDGIRREYFDSSLLLYTQTMLSLYQWVYNLALAARKRRDDGSNADLHVMIADASAALSQIILLREKASEGRFTHWYDGDRLMNIREMIHNTQHLQTADIA